MVIDFRLISPLRVDCLVQPGVEFRQKQENFDFWESVASEAGAEHLRQPPGHGGLQYESASSVDLPNDIAVLRCAPEVPRDYLQSLDSSIEIQRLEWSLCDFGILLVELLLRVNVGERSPAEIERDVQAAATVVNEGLATASYMKIREAIKSRPNHEEFTVFDHGEPIQHAWASRAMLFDGKLEGEDAEAQQRFAIEWLGGGRRSRDIVEQIMSGKIHHYAEWMNYIYLHETSENAQLLQENWKALLRSQFYYAAMGRIDTKLTEILSWAMSRSPDISTTKLKNQLRREMDFAEALFLKKSEVGKFVNPDSRLETERILAVWNFDDVLADPVQMKLQICQTRLDNIDAERARSAGFFTDLILMVIGVTSVLGTTLAVVSLGRSASSDPNQTVYDLGAGDLTTWIATQPIDVILLISTIISALMVIAFIFARKRSDS